MKPARTWIAFTVAALALVLVSTPASAGEGRDREGRGRGRGARIERFRRAGPGARAWMRERFARMRQRRMEGVKALGITPDQQRVALEKSRLAQPIVAEARKELARLRVARQAETAVATTPDAKTAARDAVRDVRRRTAEKLTPLAKDVLATLTPEQRAKLEGFAAARGRKLDEEKLARRVSRWLARPMTADMLEAKLGTK